MAISIQKPIEKKYLIEQLEGFERYALYDKLKKTIIDTPEQYISVTSTDPGALLIVDDSIVTPGVGEVGISTVEAVMGVGSFTVGQYVYHQEATYKDVEYYHHRYRKLSETYEWTPNEKYYIGNLCTYGDCLYSANKDTQTSTWVADDWNMVGAKSILQICESALPVVADLKEDMLFVLKNDEVDSTTSAIIHSKGLWIFDNTTKTYTQYHEYEVTDLDFAEIWDSTKTATYKGDTDKVVNSKYLYNQIKTFGDKVADELKDIMDIMKQPEYIILENKAALDAYDLTTLPDNSLAIFLLKVDETQPIVGTDPQEYYSTLYVCVCDDDGSTRTVSYIGHIQYGQYSLTALVQEMIDKEVKLTVAAHYENCESTAEGALEIVADGTTPLATNQIEQSNVSPIAIGTDISIGQYVKYVESYISDEYKFMEKKDYDTETLKNVKSKSVTYTDPEGVEADVTVDYLTFKDNEIMPRTWETKDIDFTDSSEYTPIVEN